jgi:DNA-binding transcriptional MocR family regulator
MNDEVEKIKKLAESGLYGAFKKTYFVQAENNFIRNPKYSINQKMVYLALQSYAGAVTSCYPSKSTLAKDLNTSTKTIERVLKELENLGAILVINQITENNRKTSNMYMLCDIDKNTGEFIPSSIEQFKCLTLEPIRIKGK